MFFLPTVSPRTLFSTGQPRTTRLLETSYLEKITVCVIEAMLVMLPLAQMNEARRAVHWTNQAQTKINIVKGLQTSVIHLIPGSTCHWISNRMRHKKNISQWQLIAEAGIRGCFLVKPNSQNFLNFPEHCQQVSGNLQLCLKKQFHWNVFLGNLGSFWNSYSQKLDILLCFFTIDIPFANFIYSSPNLWN